VTEHRAGFGRDDILLLSLSLVIAVGIFLLDLLIPLGVAAGVPYIAVVFLGAWLPWRHSVILLAAIGTTLTVLGYLFSAPAGIAWMVVLNRSLALFAIWLTAFLLMKRRKAEEALKAVGAGLEDRVVERTVELEKANADLQEQIAERVQAEEELRQNEARFKDFADTASDWLWEMDENLRFIYFSDRFAQSGLSAGERLGKTWVQASDDDTSQPKWRKHLADLEARRPFRDFVHEAHTPDGRLIHISVNGMPIFDETGNFTGYRGTGTDITVRHEVEDRLRQAQKMEVVGQLTAGVAHDFNNMLAVISGNAELLEDELGKDNPKLTTVFRATKRGADLTQRLLAFSRKQVLIPKVINANNLITDITDLLRRTLEEHIDIETVTVRPNSKTPWSISRSTPGMRCRMAAS
jgi:PAS domain S-box-containing protein